MADHDLENGIIAGPEFAWDGDTVTIGTGEGQLTLKPGECGDYVNDLGVIYRFEYGEELRCRVDLEEMYRRLRQDDVPQPFIFIPSSPSPPVPTSTPFRAMNTGP